MKALRHRWWLVVLVGLLGLAGTVVGTSLTSSKYVSRITLYVPVAATGAAGQVGRDDLDYTDRLVNTLQRIVESQSFRGEVADRSGIDVPLTLQLEPNSELVRIEARNSDPKRGREACTEAARVLVERVRELRVESGARQEIADDVDRLRASLQKARSRLNGANPSPQQQSVVRDQELQLEALLRQAATADLASAARTTVTVAEGATSTKVEVLGGNLQRIILGGLLGLICGAGLALLAGQLRPMLFTARDFEHAVGAPVLATMPRLKLRSGTTAQQPDPLRDAVSRLSLSLWAHQDQAPRSLAVASWRTGAGCTTLASSLAISLAGAGKRVLLVDADLADGQLETELGGSGAARGLAGLTRDDPAVGEEFAQRTSHDGLWLLPNGRSSSGAPAVLLPDRARVLLGQFTGWFDLVVVDLPALSTSPATLALASVVDGVVLVAPQTPYPSSEMVATASRLERLGAKLSGLVLNRSETVLDEREA